MIIKILTNSALWGLILVVCAMALVADYIEFVEPFSVIWVNVLRGGLVVSFILILVGAVRH